MTFDAMQGKLVQKGQELEIEWASSGFSPNRSMTPAEFEIFTQAMRRQAAEYARIMSPLKETPAARALANIALLEAFERQTSSEPVAQAWRKDGDLAQANPQHPSFQNGHYIGQPKCNLFLSEVFFESKRFAAPRSMPTADGIANAAKRLVENGQWIGGSQPRWFDIVPIEEAKFGDILVIHSKDRVDMPGVAHGHVEFIQEIVRNEQGAILDIRTIGARSADGAKTAGMNENNRKRTTFGKHKQGLFELHAATKIIRVRLSR